MKSFCACDVRFGHVRAFMRIASLRQADGLIVAVARMYQSDDFFSEICWYSVLQPMHIFQLIQSL